MTRGVPFYFVTHNLEIIMLIRCLALVMLLSANVNAADDISATKAEPSLEHLAQWMTGSFSSAMQATADSDYFDIRLKMTAIWRERSDGPWIYVEQAVADFQDKPYRQRVYHLTRQDDHFLSAVLELPDPLRFAGAWKEETPLAALTPDSLTARSGCAVRLRWEAAAQAYIGTTPERECESTLQGASWATSEVTVTADGIVSWDRGYDAAGEQVWGAVKGGYVFRRSVIPGGACCAPGQKKPEPKQD